MIQINLKNGSTIHFDLGQKQGHLGFQKFCNNPNAPDLITGLGILHNKKCSLIPIPKTGKVYGIGGNILLNKKNNTISGESVWYRMKNFLVTQTVYMGDHEIAKVEVKEM